MRPLRILHVTPYGADAWAYGGIPRVASAFIRELARQGHFITVCTTDAGGPRTRLPSPGPHGDRIDVRVFPNRSNRLAHDWQLFLPVGLHDWLKDHARDFDVAHLHACRNLPGAIAAHHLRRHGVPFVLAPNGTAPLIERRFTAKRLFDALAGRRMMQEAAAVLAVSEAERRDLIALGVSDARVRLVPNPIDLSEFSPPIARGRFRARAGLTSERLVAFLGKITPRKRLDLLVRAFAALRRSEAVRLVIAGNDMGGLGEALALAGTLGIRDRISVIDVMAGRERFELLADADVVVYPSEREAFGLVPLEAMLAGSPVIVADDSGCGEIVTGTGGGLVVQAGDHLQLANAINAVLSAPDSWRAAARSAATCIRDRFGAETVTSQLVDVYRQAIDQAPVESTVRLGVSFVVPVKNGLATIARTLTSIEEQADGRPFEIICVDDRSTDGSAEWLHRRSAEGRIRLLAGSGRGPSAAMNLGIRAARHPIICQVDQDVELLPAWLEHVVVPIERDARVGAAQGQYTTDSRAPLISRAMGLDLEQRYRAIADGVTDHVCTGNTAYRASALADAGWFDETLGYGNDNAMSYQLRERGWRLVHSRRARSLHRWRDTLAGYCRQQYGFGYGRLDVLARHPRRLAGDHVSPALMMAHPILMLAALACLLAGFLKIGALILAALIVERTVAGLSAWWRFSDRAALLFPILHVVRDLAWVAAILTWTSRRLTGRQPQPLDSMGHAARQSATPERRFIPVPTRILVVIPAHNEAATLSSVVADVRAMSPDVDVLVVDDGSTDATGDLLPRLGIRYLQLPERMGVGCAMRAGLKYARRLGYDAVVRLDGDGQHCAEDIAAVLEPLKAGRADVVLGSRFMSSTRSDARVAHRMLGFALSLVTGRRITDPTSGFNALGPRALRLLSEHHPTGYPEAELRLFLSHNRLTSVEVPVISRARMGGRTSLTPFRILAAGARVLLAMLIVPLRPGAGAIDRE